MRKSSQTTIAAMCGGMSGKLRVFRLLRPSYETSRITTDTWLLNTWFRSKSFKENYFPKTDEILWSLSNGQIYFWTFLIHYQRNKRPTGLGGHMSIALRLTYQSMCMIYLNIFIAKLVWKYTLRPMKHCVEYNHKKRTQCQMKINYSLNCYLGAKRWCLFINVHFKMLHVYILYALFV